MPYNNKVARGLVCPALFGMRWGVFKFQRANKPRFWSNSGFGNREDTTQITRRAAERRETCLDDVLPFLWVFVGALHVSGPKPQRSEPKHRQNSPTSESATFSVPSLQVKGQGKVHILRTSFLVMLVRTRVKPIVC